MTRFVAFLGRKSQAGKPLDPLQADGNGTPSDLDLDNELFMPLATQLGEETEAIRILLVNCANLAIEEAGPSGKLIVHRATDGTSAAEHCAQHEYRLALVQLPLPDLTPKHLMYYLRQRVESKCHKTSVITIAEAKDQALIHEGLKAGVNDYLIAPVSRERLEAVLSQIGRAHV